MLWNSYSLRLKIHDFQIFHLCTYFTQDRFLLLLLLLLFESSSSPSHWMILVSTGLLAIYQIAEKHPHFIML